jgi:hypothetical protein
MEREREREREIEEMGGEEVREWLYQVILYWVCILGRVRPRNHR